MGYQWPSSICNKLMLLLLVKPSASQDEVDRIVESNDPSQIFAQSVREIRRLFIVWEQRYD